MPLKKDDVAAFLSEQLDMDAGSLDDDLPLFSSSLLDSTSMVALVTFLEQSTGLVVEVSDLTLDNFDTIARIISFCNARST